MKNLLTSTAPLSQYEDSLIPILLHLAKTVAKRQTEYKELVRYNEESFTKVSTEADKEVLQYDNEKSEAHMRGIINFELRKFKAAYALAKLELGEIAIVLALANRR